MRANPFSHRQVGSGLLVVLFTMVLTSFLVAAIFSVTNSHVNIARRTVERATAVNYADGVIESLYDQWRQAMINVTTTADRSGGLANSALTATLKPPTSTELPSPAGVSLSSWSVTAATPLLTPTTDAAGRPTAENGTRSRMRVRIYYVASATVQFRGPAGNNRATVQRVFVRAGRNLFDNFYFGTQSNTEFHPGPEMFVNGTVFVGGNLFTAHNSLNLLKDVTFTGTHTLDFRKEDSRFGKEKPDIGSGGVGDNWDINNPPRMGEDQKLFDTLTSSLDPNFTDDPSSNDKDSDGNLNNDGFHELIEEQVAVTDPKKADPLQLDPVTSERLASNADYRIYVDAANTVNIYKGAATTALATSNSEYKAIAGALTTNTALRDVRDGDNVRVVTLDVGKITTAHKSAGVVDSVGGSDGYVFYLVDKSAGTSVATRVVNSSSGLSTAVTSSRSRGVKLVNGGTLPDVGLTVVSPNSVYIKGDYNTGSTSSTQPASNTATSYTPPKDTPNPVVGTYTRPPSAVVGDAVNILSNAWNDANSLLDKSSREAKSTTVNTAIVAGNVPTTSSSYSGGIENFSRFHEDWSDAYFTVYGALALLYNSQQATRPWSAADYTPPQRRWYYDTLLQDNNPPGFRVARVYSRGRWTQR
jgi:Tfp pilus assembly protein PilX